MSRLSLVKTKGCSYHNRVFLCRCVAIEFWPRPEGFLSQQYIFRSRQTLDKGQRVSCHDKVFCVATGYGQDQGTLCCNKEICVVTKLVQARSFLVATECFYVAIELATTKSSVAHNRAGVQGWRA